MTHYRLVQLYFEAQENSAWPLAGAFAIIEAAGIEMTPTKIRAYRLISLIEKSVL